MKYVFKNPFNLCLAFLIDSAGYLFLTLTRIFKKPPLNPKNILVIRLDHIGDFVCAGPLFRNIKAAFPQAKVTALVNPAVAELAKANPYINEVLSLPAPWLRGGKCQWLAMLEVLKKIKKGKFDLGIEARGDFFSILLMALGKIRYKVGYGITGGGFLLDKEARYDKKAHPVEKNNNLLKALSLPVVMVEPKIYFSNEDRNFVDRLLADTDLSKQKLLVLHPYAGTPAKQWGEAKFRELIAALSNNGWSIILTGCKEERPPYAGVIDLREKLSLPQTAYLLKRIGLFIGLDSGPANMALALDVPSVIICSGTNHPEAWLPKSGKSILLYKEVPCKPCANTVCSQKTHYCMDEITVENVLSVISRTQPFLKGW